MINLFLRIRLWFVKTFFKSVFKNYHVFNNKDYKVTFYDNFRNYFIDRNKWRTDPYYGERFHPENIMKYGKAPLIYFADDAVICSFGNNGLRLENRKETTHIHYIDFEGKDWGEFDIPYVSGLIDNSISFDQRYGYFEIRSCQPDTFGCWTAFWLVSRHCYPPEIDIYEIYTGKKNGRKSFNSNVHLGKDKTHKSKVKTHHTTNNAKEYHVYACLWTEKSIKFYFDNLLVRVFNKRKVLDKYFQYPMHVVINNSVCEWEGHNLTKAEFPNYYLVDYVIVYNKK
jgi:beta-glucanase (GH16 family)